MFLLQKTNNITNYVDSKLRIDQNVIYNYSCVSTSDEGNVILPKVA